MNRTMPIFRHEETHLGGIDLELGRTLRQLIIVNSAYFSEFDFMH